MEDTPWMRLQLRAVGLVFCLFILMVVSGIVGGNTKTSLLADFHKNLLMALWLAFVATWVVGIVLGFCGDSWHSEVSPAHISKAKH